MFQLAGFAFPINREYHVFNVVGCPIGRSPDKRLFAPTRSLSQLVTSFIASESQGIRHAPLLTFLSTVRLNAHYQYQDVKELFPSPAFKAGFVVNTGIEPPYITDRDLHSLNITNDSLLRYKRWCKAIRINL